MKLLIEVIIVIVKINLFVTVTMIQTTSSIKNHSTRITTAKYETET